MAGERIGFRHLWDVVANETAGHLSINGDPLPRLTPRRHAAEELYMDAMMAGYRDELKLRCVRSREKNPLTGIAR